MASIRQDPRDPNRWQIRFIDIDGKDTTRRLKGITGKRQAEKILTQVEHRLANGLHAFERDTPRAPGARLVTESIDEWSHLIGQKGAGAGQRGIGGERAGKDDGRWARKWLVTCPVLGGVEASDFNLDVVYAFLGWLPDTGLAAGTQRNLFTMLSRWCSWALSPAGKRIVNGNPCRDVPKSQRPQPELGDRSARPWVKDDETLHRLMGALPTPVDLALWLGNRSGLRIGETFGLRLSDLDEIDAGHIRVCRSWGGPLKESKRGEWASKWVVAPVDVVAVIGPLVASRRSAGALAADLLFVPPAAGARSANAKWLGFLPHTVNGIWRRAQKIAGYTGDWKSATRHSYVSRNVMAGVDIEAISRSIGHASVETTRKNYEHVIRIKYPDGLRAQPLRPAPLRDGQQIRAAETQPGADLERGQISPPGRLS